MQISAKTNVLNHSKFTPHPHPPLSKGRGEKRAAEEES